MATIATTTLVHMPGNRQPRPGKPSLPTDEAERVRAAMNRLYKEKYEENATAMAADIGISPPALGKLLMKDGNKPSVATVIAVAKILGIDEIALRRGEMPRTAGIDDLDVAVRYWPGRWSEEDIARARKLSDDGERWNAQGWTLRLDEIKSSRLAKQEKASKPKKN